ncbi:MAG TPA: PspC domain-containing protein [Sphingomicrobium sp.]|nr:PspC domain-containing protein [Sphingomicrobium sp.]
MNAQTNEVALPLRSHTILGVCEAIGEDFGFNPTFLRIPLAMIVLWNLGWAIALYLGLGAIVLASRLLFPKPPAAEIKTADQPQERELAKAA